MIYDEVFAKHQKVALQFSGGKDSLAVLYKMQPYWDRLTVYFCNSGDQFPEHLERIRKIADLVPHFVEVQGRQPNVIQFMGWPSDLLTSGSTAFGRMLGHDEPALIDRYSCCFHSIMKPIYDRMKLDGVTLIIRGQKNDDNLKPPLRSGATQDGFEFLYPIEGMSTAEVFSFLEGNGVEIPACYGDGATSAPDCMHCTAWLEHSAHKYLKTHHPAIATVVSDRLKKINNAVAPYMMRLLDAVEG